MLANLGFNQRVEFKFQPRNVHVGENFPILAAHLPRVAQNNFYQVRLEHGKFFLQCARLSKFLEIRGEKKRVGDVGVVEGVRENFADVVLEFLGDSVNALARDALALVGGLCRGVINKRAALERIVPFLQAVGGVAFVLIGLPAVLWSPIFFVGRVFDPARKNFSAQQIGGRVNENQLTISFIANRAAE